MEYKQVSRKFMKPPNEQNTLSEINQIIIGADLGCRIQNAVLR